MWFLVIYGIPKESRTVPGQARLVPVWRHQARSFWVKSRVGGKTTSFSLRKLGEGHSPRSFWDEIGLGSIPGQLLGAIFDGRAWIRPGGKPQGTGEQSAPGSWTKNGTGSGPWGFFGTIFQRGMLPDKISAKKTITDPAETKFGAGVRLRQGRARTRAVPISTVCLNFKM